MRQGIRRRGRGGEREREGGMEGGRKRNGEGKQIIKQFMGINAVDAK